MKKLVAVVTIILALTLLQCASQKEGPVKVSEAPMVTPGPLGTMTWQLDHEFVKQLLALDESGHLNDSVQLVDSEVSEEETLGEESDSRSFGGRFGGPNSAAPSAAPARGVGGQKLGLSADQGGQAQTWRRAGARTNATTLKIGDEDELALLGIEATAWVDGIRARVLLDCLYRNDRDQQLEGTFKLRLPEGATPYYLAFGEEVLVDGKQWELGILDHSLELGPEPESILDVRDGRWKGARAARFVPKGQAARAYKETVRQQVDPALMEWAGAGIFQARVFPLVPGATHRIVVGYEVDLVAVPETPGQYEFALDMPQDLVGLSLDIHVLAPGGSDVQVLPAVSSASGYGSRKTYSYGATAARAFTVRVDDLDTAALVAPEDTGYFAMDIAPALPKSTWAGSRTAVFAVDSSLSSANGGFETWLDLMQATLENNRGQLDEFAVLFFDVTPRWWRPSLSSNSPSAIADLRRYAEGLALEGASDLGSALAEAAKPSWASSTRGTAWDLFLLSDGAATWGASTQHALSAALEGGATGPLFAYTTGQSGTDRRALEHLTRESGGAIFAVNGPADIGGASIAHHGMPWGIESMTLVGCSDLLLRGRPTGVFPGQRLRLVGRGTPRKGDAVELVLTQAGRREAMRFPILSTLETTLAARAYGEIATAQLEEFGRTTRKAAEAFGTRFRVPGKACSLLMLESEEDYIAQGFLPEGATTIARTAAAGPMVASALDLLSGVLDDPARALLELLEPLAQSGSMRRTPARIGEFPDLDPIGGADAPLVALMLDPEFVLALSRMPKSALQIVPEALAYRGLERVLIPAGVTEALLSGEPAYSLIQDEAARRLLEMELGDAVRVLSSLVELNPGDGVFARDVAQTMMQWGLFGHAYHLYLRVAESRPFEPQSYLSLARCAEESGQADLALAWYTVALEGDWDSRFGDFHQIVAFDALHFMRKLERGEMQAEMSTWALAQVASIVELVGYGEADLAVAIQWNTDVTDIDLHVIEPTGEHCFYGSRDTSLGAHLSQDVTQGYGPELYVLPHASAGPFSVYVHFFSGDPNKTSVRTKILATVYQKWGSKEEIVIRREILLETKNEDHGIVRIDIE
jgi:tetratricopeptide (TPR) repeat protein